MKLSVRDLIIYAEAGWTAAEIADHFVVTDSAVYAACQKHNVKLSRAVRKDKGKFDPLDIEREALIQQSVTEAWTQQELADKLGLTRERARQLLKKRGLDKIRVRWHGRNAHTEPKERPIRRCRECGQIILDTQRWRYCSGACYQVWLNRYHAEQKNARYHQDPDFRENHLQWQRDNPEKAAAAQKRYRETIGGQLHYEARLNKFRTEPKEVMQCLDCGTLIERKATVVKVSRQHGRRSPLCKDCQMAAARAARGLG